MYSCNQSPASLKYCFHRAASCKELSWPSEMETASAYVVCARMLSGSCSSICSLKRRISWVCSDLVKCRVDMFTKQHDLYKSHSQDVRSDWSHLETERKQELLPVVSSKKKQVAAGDHAHCHGCQLRSVNMVAAELACHPSRTDVHRDATCPTMVNSPTLGAV
jgi:hypothetical protein